MLYQCSYSGNADKKDPYLAPLCGNFEGFPPMLMQVGAYEVLLDDTRTAAKKAREEGVKVRCSVYDGMFHVFQMGLDLIPESREAWEEDVYKRQIRDEAYELAGEIKKKQASKREKIHKLKEKWESEKESRELTVDENDIADVILSLIHISRKLSAQ